MPGRLLLVDTQRGEVIKDEELKHNISTARPVTRWLNEGLVSLKDIHNAYNKLKGLPEGTVSVTKKTFVDVSIHHDRRLPTFGYSVEDISMLVLPMIRNRLDLYRHYRTTLTSTSSWRKMHHHRFSLIEYMF